MKAQHALPLAIVVLFLSFSCKKNSVTAISTNYPPVNNVPRPPNIIFLLSDDVGYEMPTFDGGQSYNTTHLDSLAANGMVFTQCRATPLCSPSRVELLSGLYNFRNYLKYGWGTYDPAFISYANVLQNNGYKTCVVGKWQLNTQNFGIQNVGFDNYCIWDEGNAYAGPTYKNPTIYEDIGVLTSQMNYGKYTEDITGDYAMNFIDHNKDRPFFLYYSFLLVHSPFQPTPLDPSFRTEFDKNFTDTTYIGSMTHYLDLKVGALINKLKADGLDKNTIIVFTGDNGSETSYHSRFKGKLVKGAKGTTWEFGTHVPLFVYWPGHIAPGINNNLVDFSDFAPTFLDMANVTNKPAGWDGVSFYPQLFGNDGPARTWTYCYYDPFPYAIVTQPVSKPMSYAQDTAYKLYKTGVKSGNFYHFTKDLNELKPLSDSHLTPEQVAIKQKLQGALTALP